MTGQDLNRTQLIKDITSSANYCNTDQLQAVLTLMIRFKDKNEERNGTSKEAPIRSMENTSKEDN